MTRDDAIAEIVSLSGLTPDDVNDLSDPALSVDELAALIDGYKAAGKVASRSVWDVLLEIMGKVVELAPIVGNLVQAVQVIYPLL